MKFTRVIQTDVGDDEATLHMLGEDEKQYALTVTPEAASQIQAALLPVAIRLREKHQGGQHGIVLEMTGLQPFLSESGEGIVLTLKDGGELALQMNREQRAALRACIDQLETGIPPDGQTH